MTFPDAGIKPGAERRGVLHRWKLQPPNKRYLTLVAQNKTFATSFPPASSRLSSGGAIIKKGDQREMADGGAERGTEGVFPSVRAARLAAAGWLSAAWRRDYGTAAGNTCCNLGGWQLGVREENKG